MNNGNAKSSSGWGTNGKLVWESSSKMPLVPGQERSIYTLNGKFAFAVAMTQVQRRGAENFARAMGMCVPML
jgi:hypothetical protein